MPPATKSATRSPRSSSGTGAGSRGMTLTLARSYAADDLQHLGDRAVQVVVDHDVVVVGREGHLLLRDHLPRRALLGALGFPQSGAPDELLHRRRREKDEGGVAEAGPHLLRAFDVDLQDHIVPRLA